MEVFVPSWQEELEPRVDQAWEDTPPLLGCLLAVHSLCHCAPWRSRSHLDKAFGYLSGFIP